MKFPIFYLFHFIHLTTYIGFKPSNRLQPTIWKSFLWLSGTEFLVKFSAPSFCYYCYSVAKSCLTLCGPTDAACQAFLSFSISQSLLRFISIESVMLCNPLILYCPIFSSFISIQVFSSELAIYIKWSKHWSFNVSIRPSDEYSVLISSRTDWFNLLAVLGTLRSLFQHHNSKTSVLWQSTFFMVQLSFIHDHWKNHHLTIGPLLAKWCLCLSVHCLDLS